MAVSASDEHDNFSWAQSAGTIVLPVRPSPLQGLGIAQVRMVVEDGG